MRLRKTGGKESTINERTTMAEKPLGDKAAEKAAEPMKLAEAVRIVNAAIEEETRRLKEIAATEALEPIMLEGRTVSCYYVQLMIDPAKAAPVMLDYCYPMYKVLEEDAPQEMWDALARLVGLDEVISVDI